MKGDKFIELLGSKVLEVTRQSEEQVTILVERADLPEVVSFLYYDCGGWLSTMVANDERELNKHFALYYAISLEGSLNETNAEFKGVGVAEDECCYIIVKTLIPANNKTYPSVTPKVPAAVWYEREAFDMFGLVAEGLPDKRRLVLSDDLPEDFHPLLKDFDYRTRPEPVSYKNEPDYAFNHPKSEAVTDIPLGPLHITADEPGHFRLYCDGDTIVDADYRLFYQHRGMEKLAENRMHYTQMGFLAERVCGICGFSHSIACAEATEIAAGIEVPRRAEAIRVMCAEVERLHSHLLNMGLACEVTGNYTAFMHIFRVREKTMFMAQLLTGARKTYGMILPGGVRRDVSERERIDLLRLCDEVAQELKDIWQVVLEDKRQMGRWKGVGVLDYQVARDFSPVGPNIKSSGFLRDSRISHKRGFYRELDVERIVEASCDVYGREQVRYREVLNSLSLIKQCLDKMPQGEIMTRQNWRIKPWSYALGVVEAPRGELIHFVMQSKSQKVYRWRARASTYNNWPSLRFQLQNNTIADAALIVCSLDPCYSCTDRVTLTDIKSGKSRVISDKELKAIARGEKI